MHDVTFRPGLATQVSLNAGCVLAGEIVPQSICSQKDIGLKIGAHSIWLVKAFMYARELNPKSRLALCWLSAGREHLHSDMSSALDTASKHTADACQPWLGEQALSLLGLIQPQCYFRTT